VTLNLQRARLYEQLVDMIRKQIVEGKLKQGDQLPNERDLALQYGVSRTVVREAIKALVQKGLIEVRGGTGTFVTDSTTRALQHSLELMMSMGKSDHLKEVVELREILEPEIAARAAAHATREQIKVLRAAFETMSANLDSVTNFIVADNQFHLALATATGNTLFPKILNSVVDLLFAMRSHIFSVEGGPQRGQWHHAKILEAVSAGDSDRARRAMVAHLQQVRADTEANSVDRLRKRAAKKVDRAI
jgi:GntR family transcriptional repressor for pyruvate dehydrogenase complex